MTNQQVADDFANGETKGRSNNMFIEDLKTSTVVYSYGEHFPIAIKTSEFFAYFNSKKYSVTTSIHKGRVKRALETNGVEIEEKTTQELKDLISEISIRNYEEYKKQNGLTA